MDSLIAKIFVFIFVFTCVCALPAPGILEFRCDLITAEKSSAICSLKPNLTKFELLDGQRFTQVFKSSGDSGSGLAESSSALPSVVELDAATGNLNWLNKYQPVSTRWTQLCPSAGQQQPLYPVNNFYCFNYQTCDATGTCTVKFKVEDSKSDASRMILVHLNDNLKEGETEAPAFPADLQLINLSVDSNMFDYGSDGLVDTELVLIESTARLNSYTSKPNRLLNDFQLNMIESDKDNEDLVRRHCGGSQSSGSSGVGENPFSIRLDSANEKLYLKFKNSNVNKELFRKKTCFVYSLSVQRPGSGGQPSLAIVVVNIADNRVDQPVFEFAVYNFTIVENSPFNTLIGQVHAVYSNKQETQESPEESLIKYRIVPFLASFDGGLQQQTADSDETSGANGLPVKINAVSGWLNQKLNIDREKYLTSLGGMDEDAGYSASFMFPKFGKQAKTLDPNNDGLLRLNIESSYASISYAYCQVNIFIQDVNDNAPVARIKPLPNFGPSNQQLAAKAAKSQQQASGQVVNLFANEHTSVNQIMAYLSVFDPDAGENGTIKAIDLNLVSYKRAPESVLRTRAVKLSWLKQAKLNASMLSTRTGSNGLMAALSSAQVSIPFKLNKIGDKMYTIQLVSKLDFSAIESFTVDMKVKDAGTRPQLESNTRIVLNVIDHNDFAPVFIHKSAAVSEIPLELAENEQPRDPVILRLNAVDLDDDKNGQVKYRIVNNPYGERGLLDTTFQLDQDSGELRLLRPLNRDETDGDAIELVVVAQDQAEPGQTRLSATCVVRIRVLDKNNHSPVISHYYAGDKIDLQVSMDELSASNASSNASAVAPSVAGRRSALMSKRYKQISDVISLVDADSFDTNSKNYLAFMSKNQSSIDDQFTSKASFVFSDEKCFKSIGLKFRAISSPVDSADETDDESRMDFPFVFLVEEQGGSSGQSANISSVRCQMTIWVDVEKQRLINSMNPELKGRDLSYEFAVNAFDYGDESLFVEKSRELKVSVSLLSSAPRWPVRMALFGLSQDQDEELQDKLLVAANLTKMTAQSQPISLVQFVLSADETGQKPTVQLHSVSKLLDRSDSIHTRLVQQAANPQTKAASFKLIDLDVFKAKNGSFYHRVNLVFEPTSSELLDGIYLVNLAVQTPAASNSTIQSSVSLKQIQLIAFNNQNNNNYSYEIKLNQLRQYYEQADLIINDYYKNQLNRLFSGGVENYNGDAAKKPPSIFETQSLMQFQNLLMLGNGNLNSSFGGLANSPAGSGSAPFSFFAFLLNNRSSYVQFIIVLVLVSLSVLAFIVCCIAFIIRRNCWCNSSAQTKKTGVAATNGGETSSNSGASYSGDSSTKSSLASSSLTNKLFNKSKDTSTLTTLASSKTPKNKDFKNLNVIDDNDKLDSSDNGGFVTASETKNNLYLANQVTDTKEKVTRYLDALDVTILTRHHAAAAAGEVHSSEHYQQISHVQHHHVRTDMMCNEPAYNIISYGENAPNTGSSSPASSLTATTFTNSSASDKKHLVIAVEKTEANTVSSSNANSSSNKQSSVCTLSTTSSSCVSDEGCYGSSDFSSERDSHQHALKLRQKQQQQQHQLTVNSSANSSSFRNSSDQLSLYCPVVQSPRPPTTESTSALLRQKQQNYCINNLTRFERIYNSTKKPESSSDQSNCGGDASFTLSLTSPSASKPPPSHGSVKNSPFLKFQNATAEAEKINTISGSYV